VLPAAASSSSLLLSVAEAAKRRPLRVILGKGRRVAGPGRERDAALAGRMKREGRGRREETIMAAF
jgi:hypothetical protein